MLIGSSRQFSGFDRRVDVDLLQASLRRATRFVPGLADLQVVRTWAGLRPYTRDKLPILGAVDEVPGFYMAGGHEGLGITLSMVTGELLAQCIQSGSNDALEGFTLDRLRDGNEGRAAEDVQGG